VTGEALHERLRAAAEEGEEALLEVLGELEGDELAEAMAVLLPAPTGEPLDRGRWGRL